MLARESFITIKTKNFMLYNKGLNCSYNAIGSILPHQESIPTSPNSHNEIAKMWTSEVTFPLVQFSSVFNVAFDVKRLKKGFKRARQPLSKEYCKVFRKRKFKQTFLAKHLWNHAANFFTLLSQNSSNLAFRSHVTKF